jgi:hypothetical protein
MTTAEFVALIRTRQRIQGYRPAALLELAEHEEVELLQASEIANLQAEADAELVRRPHAGRALQRGWVDGPLPAPRAALHRVRGELLLTPAGAFLTILRMYQPQLAVLDGHYVLPPITRL